MISVFLSHALLKRYLAEAAEPRRVVSYRRYVLQDHLELLAVALRGAYRAAERLAHAGRLKS